MKKNVSFLIASAALLCGCETSALRQSSVLSQDPSRVAYARIYCTADNESHFETVPVELARVDAAPPAAPFFAKGSQASHMAFVAFDAGWGAQDLQLRKFHPAPNAQYVVYLEGNVSITTSDGETRRFRDGDVLRVDDVAPCKGHIGVVGDRPARTLIVR